MSGERHSSGRPTEGEADASPVVDAAADADDERDAVAAMADELDAEDRTDLVPEIDRWPDEAQEALIDAVEPWDDMADLIDAVVRWDDYEERVAAEFVELDPATAHPTQLAVVRDLKAHFAEGASGPFEERPEEAFLETEFFDFSYLEGREEIERYWVNEPFAYVTILYVPDRREFEYHVVEPTLDEFENYVRQDLVTLLRNSLMYQDVSDADRDREEVFAERSQELIEKHAATVRVGSLLKVYYYLTRDFIRYGPIDGMMRDSNIEDISCDGEDVPVFVYNRVYRNLRTNVVFEERQLNSFAVRLAQRAGKQLSVSEPLVDASLPDGSRVQVTLGGEISTRGSNFTIRKFADVPITPVDLVRWNTFSADEMAYFWGWDRMSIKGSARLILKF
ncbi:MAG: type II/IV secretion system ATPase subunit, partial [Haloglomus sp.]